MATSAFAAFSENGDPVWMVLPLFLVGRCTFYLRPIYIREIKKMKMRKVKSRAIKMSPNKRMQSDSAESRR
jgi:hypothetical protein